MARAPLLQLSGIGLGLPGDRLFDGIDLVLHAGDRLALVGRNGTGKSTLLKIMAGLVEPDTGNRTLPPETRVGYMEQEPVFSGFDTLGDYAAAGLAPEDVWRATAAAEGLGFDPALPAATASGGERRRAALARLLASEPDVLLLDEPTNHLDIAAIAWLEERLAGFRGAVVTISHDRAFLRTAARAILWLDRGSLRRLDRGFDAFEDWRDTVWAEEDAARHKLDRRIKAEARWAVEGISARRKRNQGRVRALAALRAERASMQRRQGAGALALESGSQSGRMVIEAEGLWKTYDGRCVLRDFSLRVLRGDRVALAGPNGAGKTTLLRLLTGQEAPDRGTLRLGSNLRIAEFDQARAGLDPDATLWDSLTGDPLLGVAGNGDQVMVRGRPRHVVGYLKDFLFDETRARAPVRSLSGGEKARLMLARIMARESNLLVLDEPTNDLDMETLDLLQEVLGDYDGTVLMVSHDRDFIDRVATTTLLFEGNGRVVVHAGGWSDLPPARPAAAADTRPEPRAPAQVSPAAAGPRPSRAAGGTPALSFSERHRLERLPDVIAGLEAEVARLAEALADPALFARDPERAQKLGGTLAAAQEKLGAAEAEWLDLAERAEQQG